MYKEALLKIIEILKINSLKKLFERLYDVHNYLCNSRKFGLLRIPYIPTR